MRVAVYVPDKGNHGESGSDVLEEVCERVCEMFGGCTVYAGFGRWIAGHGQLVAEPVHVVKAYGSAVDRESLDALALGVREALSQECVAYSYDNELRLI